MLLFIIINTQKMNFQEIRDLEPIEAPTGAKYLKD